MAGPFLAPLLYFGITMKQIIYSLIAGIAITACNNSTPEEKTTDATTTVKSETPTSQCYIGTSGKDSILLNLTGNGETVNGELSYLFSEKDRNTGTIEGVFHGDTLLADYSFMSEGTMSKRQVAFLKQDNKLLEGYGDMSEESGGTKFKSPASLSFGKGFNLEKTDCK